jgi:hypothetical protein
MRRRPRHAISVEALFQRREPSFAPATSTDQPWIEDENTYVEIDLPARQPERRPTGGGRLHVLRASGP